MKDQELVGIIEANSDLELLLYRTVLQEAGIDVMARRVGAHVVTGDIFRLRQPHYLLQVRAEDAERARPLIEEYREKVESGEMQVEDLDLPENAVTAKPFSRRKWLAYRVVLTILIAALLLTLIFVIPQLLQK